MFKFDLVSQNNTFWEYADICFYCMATMLLRRCFGEWIKPLHFLKLFPILRDMGVEGSGDKGKTSASKQGSKKRVKERFYLFSPSTINSKAPQHTEHSTKVLWIQQALSHSRGHEVCVLTFVKKIYLPVHCGLKMCSKLICRFSTARTLAGI